MLASISRNTKRPVSPPTVSSSPSCHRHEQQTEKASGKDERHGDRRREQQGSDRAQHHRTERLDRIRRGNGQPAPSPAISLKFSKGDYLAGQDNREIAAGTRLTVNMDTLEIGWIKWEDSRPVRSSHGPLCQKASEPAKRNELGDEDQRAVGSRRRRAARAIPGNFPTTWSWPIPTRWRAVYVCHLELKGGLNAIGAALQSLWPGDAAAARTSGRSSSSVSGPTQHRIKTLWAHQVSRPFADCRLGAEGWRHCR